jgi:DNA replication licensing factor MCM6
MSNSRVYNITDIQKYITFARLCKPIISEAAKEVMITEYKKLRQRESSNKSAWRITVRQLESMIRLSEGLARMHLLEEVTEEHVHEAFRLLSKSIIRVEQPDIQFDENVESMLHASKRTTETLGAGESDVPSQMETDEAPEATKKPNVKLSYDEYKRISNMLVYYIRKKEEEIDSESETFTGIHKSELAAWYLNEVESMIENEDQLNEQNTLIEKIIHRLIHYDNVIIQLDKMGLKPTEKADEVADESDPILVVHPNYVPAE